MLKKLLAVLLSLTILTGLVTVPAYAIAADGYYQTFSGLDDDLSVQVQYPDGSYIIGGNASWVDGVGGKEVSDRSLKLVGNDANYFRQDFVMKDNVVIEFSVMFPGANNSASEYKSFRFGPKGSVMNSEILHKSGAYSQNRWDAKVVDVNKWTHFAYEFDCAAGTYNVYIDGVSYKTTAAIPSSVTNGSTQQFRFVSYNATDEYPIYLDDIKYYAGTYDASNASATIASVTGGKVDEAKKTVAFYSDVDVADVATVVTASEGAYVAGVMDGDTFMTKTEGIVEDGDAVVLCAADGVTYTKYTVGFQKTASYSQNFPNSVAFGGWPNTASGEYLCAGGTNAGIGGKAANDNSALITSGYFRRDITPYGKTTIEFNTLVTTSNWGYIGVSTSNTNMAFFQGSNKLNNTSKTYECGRWYRLAYVIDLSTGKYDLYLDGEKVVTAGSFNTAVLKEGVNNELRFYGDGRYYDDIKIYAGEYNPEGSVATLTSDAIAVDDDYKTLSIVKGTVADYIAKLTPSDGATITGVADSESFLTKAGTDAIEEGDLVAVLAPDGVSYNYYKVSGNVVNSYVDDDFTGLTGTRISDYKNGDGQAASAGLDLTRTGLGLNTETGEGAFIEVVEENGNEVLMLYSNGYGSEPFFGRNLSGGTANANAVEFSVMKPDKKSPTKLLFYGPKESTVNEDSNWSLINAYAATFETDGLIYFNSEAVCKWNTNEWYRVVVTTDIPNNKMTLYLNGVKAAEKVLDDPIVKMYDIRFAGLKGTNESFTYFDDVKWYDYNGKAGFDDSEKIAALTAKSSNVTIETGVAFGTIDTTLATVGAILNEVEPTGTMKAYDASGVEIVDTTVAPAHGMYIEVTSIDGLAKAKYTYVVDSISDIFFDVEGNETTSGTISAKIHIVNSDEENTEVGKLFIAKYEGNKLVGVNFAKVDARCKVGGYVDNVFSASIDVVDSTKESIKAFYFGANGVKPLKGDKELSVSSTNF